MVGTEIIMVQCLSFTRQPIELNIRGGWREVMALAVRLEDDLRLARCSSIGNETEIFVDHRDSVRGIA
jgi:hypothetical protein